MSAMRSWLRARLVAAATFVERAASESPRPSRRHRRLGSGVGAATVAAQQAATIAERATIESPRPSHRGSSGSSTGGSNIRHGAAAVRVGRCHRRAPALLPHAASASAPPQSESPGRASPPTPLPRPCSFRCRSGEEQVCLLWQWPGTALVRRALQCSQSALLERISRRQVLENQGGVGISAWNPSPPLSLA